ncbi:MAG: SufE family protein [Pseudomonadota bacterium]
MIQTPPSFDDIADDFGFIEDWDEKYRYLIDLGRHLPPFPKDAQTEETKVRGCASQVWLTFEEKEGSLFIQGDSDASIVKGLIALLISLYNGQSAEQIIKINAEEKLKAIDLNDHITPQRSNGVASMITRIRQVAEERL